jgi:hypothetical protein
MHQRWIPATLDMCAPPPSAGLLHLVHVPQPPSSICATSACTSCTPAAIDCPGLFFDELRLVATLFGSFVALKHPQGEAKRQVLVDSVQAPPTQEKSPCDCLAWLSAVRNGNHYDAGTESCALRFVGYDLDTCVLLRVVHELLFDSVGSIYTHVLLPS